MLVLPAMEKYPDSTFIEDAAIFTPDSFILARPAMQSRLNEPDSLRHLSSFSTPPIKTIQAPGTLEGGDVLLIENVFYIGMGNRTNLSGFMQFTDIVSKKGFHTVPIALKQFLHLKTGISYLGQGLILIGGELIHHPAFDKFSKIIANPQETYACNTLNINDHILTPKGFPGIKKQLNKYNFPVIELEMSEFLKMDGGLSCLSIRY